MSLSLFRLDELNWSSNRSYDSSLTLGRKILKPYQDANQEHYGNSSKKRKIVMYNKILMYNKIEIKDETSNNLHGFNIVSNDLVVIKANIQYFKIKTKIKYNHGLFLQLLCVKRLKKETDVLEPKDCSPSNKGFLNSNIL
jgi:hypothetical protein